MEWGHFVPCHPETEAYRSLNLLELVAKKAESLSSEPSSVVSEKWA